MDARRNGRDAPLHVRGDAGGAKVRPGRHANAFKGRLAVAFGAAGDRAGDEVFAGEVIGVEGGGCLHIGVELIDRDPLFFAELLVEIAPIGGEVGAVGAARRHGQIANLQDVARLGVLDEDRTGHDVDAGIAIRLGHALEDRGDALVHHQVRRIARVVGDRLGADQIATFDMKDRRDGGVEIAPMHGLRRGLQVVQRAGRRDRPGLTGLTEKSHASPLDSHAAFSVAASTSPSTTPVMLREPCSIWSVMKLAVSPGRRTPRT